MMEGALVVVMVVMMLVMCGGLVLGGLWAFTRRRARSEPPDQAHR